MILVTGGAGFIGSAFVIQWIREEKSPVLTLDKLTYAGNLNNLECVINDPLHTFVQGDICDRPLIRKLLQKYRPISIVHCAAESHVDRSIYFPEAFIQTNIVGTSALLDESLHYWKDLPEDEKKAFRFLHLSTDEVYGSLGPSDPASAELSAYAPNSPYAASKAASDHIVRSYFRTYQLPTLTTHSSNNFGPRQFPEKLIPLTILHAISEKNIPLYGDGLQLRDWIYVEDHCNALKMVLKKGTPGETYNIATGIEWTNISLVQIICHHLDQLHTRPTKTPYSELIQHTMDRPGHDRRYGINTHKIEQQLHWKPAHPFETAIKETIQWYLSHPDWIESIQSGAYRNWIETHYSKEHYV